VRAGDFLAHRGHQVNGAMAEIDDGAMRLLASSSKKSAKSSKASVQ
jgi:hypothetical protein